MAASLGKVQLKGTERQQANYLRQLLNNNCFHLHLHVNAQPERSFRLYGVRVRQKELEVSVCIKGETSWWRVGGADEIHQR